MFSISDIFFSIFIHILRVHTKLTIQKQLQLATVDLFAVIHEKKILLHDVYDSLSFAY